MKKSNKIETFEGKLQKIRELTTSLQSGQLSLEESLSAYQEARILLTECTAYLDTAELSIKQVTENGEIIPLNLEE